MECGVYVPDTGRRRFMSDHVRKSPPTQNPSVSAVVYGIHTGWRYGRILTLTSAMPKCELMLFSQNNIVRLWVGAGVWSSGQLNSWNSIEYRSAGTSYREVCTIPHKSARSRRSLPYYENTHWDSILVGEIDRRAVCDSHELNII